DASTLLFLGGIIGLIWCEAIFKSRLSPLRLGTTTFPESLPLRMSCGVSRIRPALVVVLLWHARQLFFRTGRISFSKSTGVLRSIFEIAIGLRFRSAADLSSANRHDEERNHPESAMATRLV